MTDAELRDELFTMLAAGHETTATGLAFAVDLLLRHSSVLARLREAIGDDDESYVAAVGKETLRLRPVIDAAERTRSAAYSPKQWTRLVSLKAKYDPTNFFRQNANIPPNGA